VAHAALFGVECVADTGAMFSLGYHFIVISPSDDSWGVYGTRWSPPLRLPGRMIWEFA
jgi:hypothetical protein